VALAQKRLGQEEHFSKELAIINNKLQNNISSIGAGNSKKVPTATFYEAAKGVSSSDDSGDDEGELGKRRRAWAELEREQDEVKRNIKSILKTTPMAEGGAGERIKVPPIKYEGAEMMKPDRRSQTLKEEVKREERSNQQRAPANNNNAVESSASIGSSMPAQSMKRQWTADNATNKRDTTPVKKSPFDDDIIPSSA
jgi:hypothetical protein